MTHALGASAVVLSPVQNRYPTAIFVRPVRAVLCARKSSATKSFLNAWPKTGHVCKNLAFYMEIVSNMMEMHAEPVY